QQNSWQSLAYARTVQSPAMAAIDGKVYLVGGLEGGLVNTRADVYDPRSNVWSGLPPMKVARYAATAVGLNGLLYVIGGYTANAAPVPSVEVYNPTTNTWRTVSDMPTARFWVGSGAVGGKVYAVGGHGTGPLTTTEAYTP